MRENRLYGSEGGAGPPRSYPYHLTKKSENSLSQNDTLSIQPTTTPIRKRELADCIVTTMERAMAEEDSRCPIQWQN